MPSIGELERQLRSAMGRRREASTIETLCRELRHLSALTKGKTVWDKKDLLHVLDKMIGDNLAPTTVQVYFYRWKSIHKYLEMPFPITEDDLPRGQARSVNIPSLTIDEVADLIEYVKAYGTGIQKLLTAMSTVYGVRREELSRLTVASFGPDTVKVDTAKHGVPRDHYLPPFLVPYMQAGFADLPVESVTTLSWYWKQLNKDMGRKSVNGEGWHAIRRTLTQQLDKAGVSEQQISHFMRWSGTSGSMVLRYTRPSNGPDFDREVFKKHVLLELWK